MSDNTFYSYDNNISIKKKAGPGSCECIVEQYLNVERTFSPPESLKKLDKHLQYVLGSLDLFKKKEINLFQSPVELSKTNLFSGPKRVRVCLKNSSFQAIAGALHYMKGNIEVESKMKLKMLRGKKPAPIYKGTGEVFLEPVRAGTQFLFVQVNGKVTVDRGLFYACQGTLKKKTVIIKNLGSVLFGGEGLFEHEFSGKGWLLLTIPVYQSEIHKMTLKNETLKVDGNIHLLRTGNISFGVETFGKGLGKLLNTSGEGWVNVYKGTGEVWLGPTIPKNQQ